MKNYSEKLIKTRQFWQLPNIPILPKNHSDTNTDNSDFEDNDESIHEIKQNKVYQITGKFSPSKENIIDVVITTSKRLTLDTDSITVGQPLVHLLGRVSQQTNITENGYYYTLRLQVKPYLSSTQCGQFEVILTHSIGGRFKNAFDKAKKYSSIFFIFCESTTSFSFGLKLALRGSGVAGGYCECEN